MGKRSFRSNRRFPYFFVAGNKANEAGLRRQAFVSVAKRKYIIFLARYAGAGAWKRQYMPVARKEFPSG